jgi:hypothetical protein
MDLDPRSRNPQFFLDSACSWALWRGLDWARVRLNAYIADAAQPEAQASMARALAELQQFSAAEVQSPEAALYALQRRLRELPEEDAAAMLGLLLCLARASGQEQGHERGQEQS